MISKWEYLDIILERSFYILLFYLQGIAIKYESVQIDRRTLKFQITCSVWQVSKGLQKAVQCTKAVNSWLGPPPPHLVFPRLLLGHLPPIIQM